METIKRLFRDCMEKAIDSYEIELSVTGVANLHMVIEDSLRLMNEKMDEPDWLLKYM